MSAFTSLLRSRESPTYGHACPPVPNGPARVTLDAYSKKSYEAYIREIAPEADRQKATIQVKVAITNADNLVRPEMGARVDFLAGGAETKVETAASNPTK